MGERPGIDGSTGRRIGRGPEPRLGLSGRYPTLAPPGPGRPARLTTVGDGGCLADGPWMGHPGAMRASVRRTRRGRLGLRARATVAAGLGALAATTVLSLVTYSLARAYLLSQRDLIASRQAYTNARVVRDVLRTPSPQVGELLASLRTDAGSFPLVRYRNRWFATAVGSSEEILPRVAAGRHRGGPQRPPALRAVGHTPPGGRRGHAVGRGRLRGGVPPGQPAAHAGRAPQLAAGRHAGGHGRGGGPRLLVEPTGAAAGRPGGRRRRIPGRRGARHPPQRRARPRPAPPGRLLQRDGRRHPGPHRAGGPLRLRREP